VQPMEATRRANDATRGVMPGISLITSTADPSPCVEVACLAERCETRTAESLESALEDRGGGHARRLRNRGPRSPVPPCGDRRDNLRLMDDLSSQVGALWERRAQLTTDDGDALAVVNQAIDLLDTGEARVAEIDPVTDEVIVHEWLRQAILLLFILSGVRTIEHGPFEYTDKLALKHGLQAAGVRAVPGASARRGAFLGAVSC